MDNFVVYAYCREDGTFYYIGKGQPGRPYRKRRKGARRPKDPSKILILHQGLSETTAFDYERKLILFYGRKDLGTGLLRNLTDGGEGATGWIITEAERKRRSEENYFSGKHFVGELNPMYGKERPDLSARNKEKPPAKHTLWFNNGEINKRCKPGEEPEGFTLGRINAKPNTWAAGRKWYYNDEGETRMFQGQPFEGWKPGRKP
jgi:hypothetical protein